MLISLKLMKRKTIKVYEEPAGDDIRFWKALARGQWKALARGQAWHNFNLPFCLSTRRILNTIYTCRWGQVGSLLFQSLNLEESQNCFSLVAFLKLSKLLTKV